MVCSDENACPVIASEAKQSRINATWDGWDRWDVSAIVETHGVRLLDNKHGDCA